MFRFGIPVGEASASDVCGEDPVGSESAGARTEAATERTLAVAPETLAALPAELVDEMREATNKADLDLLNDLLDQVAERDEQLAAALRDLANAFEYDTLCELFATQERDP